jgi:hypothetical protein
MNTHNFKINYDFRPYLPDIFIKQNIYNSCDTTNNNTNVDINTMIFTINIDRPINSQYNDPNYILFGVKNPSAPYEYEFPSLNFYTPKDSESPNLNITYKIVNTNNQITDGLGQILNSIGYDLLNIDENQFSFSMLELFDENTPTIKYTVLYFYFNLKNYDSNQVNYNQYEKTTYYDNKTYNVLIYPFNNNTDVIYNLININNSYTSTFTFEIPQTQTTKSIQNINFDNREIIKYYEKIDYKYFENTKFTMDEKTCITTLKNYSYLIKNYVEYINNLNYNQTINVGLNEISKIFYYSSDYNLKNPNSLTLHLNNQHINNNNTYSNQVNRYSYTMDSKISNINKYCYDSKNYSSYYYTTNTFESTLYQQTINYYLNGYYNICDTNSQSQMAKLNKFLYKIFVFINPKIIDLNYLLNNVETSINPLFNESNNLQFGKDNEKMELYVIGDIIDTLIYYINKYKIKFEFTDETTDKKFSFIIILNIAFYNKSYFNILDTDTTTNTPLAYTNITSIEESISLLPSVYSIYNSDNLNNIFFYNTLNDYNGDMGIKNYYWNINYLYDKISQTSDNIINMYNFYEIIPNILTNLKTNTDQYYNNVINVLKNKVNNYIVNFINIQKNYISYTHYINNIKKYINFATLYDETIIQDGNNDDANIKYIEYYENFPKISTDYLDLTNNYIGKYSQVLVYPFNNINISSFEILPAGSYIKYNYINYSHKLYPSDITEDFVKSIKTIEMITGYYFSLFVMKPLNINQDNEFQSVSDENFPNPTTYSMGIGGNNTQMYLVLTDIDGHVYDFYSDDDSNGVIFGIKLYNYNNFVSDNLKLPLIPNLYINKYLNLNQYVLLFENFSNYSDVNNTLWDINNSYLNLHNFNSLSEIILYDYRRFKPEQDINLTTEQYLKFNYKTLQILYENKVQLNNLRYDIKILIYISNLYKILKLIQKIYAYCETVKVNIILGDNNNTYIINLIKYNSTIISDLFEINYNLAITSGNFETKIYDMISKMSSNITISLEEINLYQSYCIYIITYSINKLPSILDSIISNLSETTNIYNNLYSQIFEQITFENINYLLEQQVIYDIDNFTSNTNINVFDNIFNNLSIHQKQLFLNQINAYLKIIAFNTTKIDELFNLAKLMANSEINDKLPINLDSIVVKNNYIYNTTYYTTQTNIPRFKIVDFLTDTINLINKQSIPANNPNYIAYQKSISEGIIQFISNTINYFEDIINTIVEIYTYLKNLSGPQINIYEPEQIGNFYSLLNLFVYNYTSFFNILFLNKIDKFYEYTNLKIMFDNLYHSSNEFLLYICLKKDFINDDTLFISENIYINEDLYKIIKTDVFCDYSIKTIQNFDNLIINKNPQLTILYLEKIKYDLEKKPKIYINEITIKTINDLISDISNTNIVSTNINFGSYYIIPYQDLLMFKGTFNWASFNFLQAINNVIKNVNSINVSIFTYYYLNPEITDFYKQALNYTYLKTPYKYININNINNAII